MIAHAANICAAACGSWRQSRPAKVTGETCWTAPRQSYTAQPGKPCCRRSLCMPHRKSARRWGQGCPAGLSIAKSADAENAGATQHSPKHRPQSARRTRCPPPRAGPADPGSSLNVASGRHPPVVTRASSPMAARTRRRSEEHTSELQSRENLVCRLLLEKKKKNQIPVLLFKKKKKTRQ